MLSDNHKDHHNHHKNNQKECDEKEYPLWVSVGGNWDKSRLQGKHATAGHILSSKENHSQGT